MSYLSFAPNLFLETQELERFHKFVDTDGFRKNILQNSITFGLIKNYNDLPFLNGRVERDLDTTTGLKTIKIRSVEAIDSRGLFISSPGVNNIPVPSDGQWHFVEITHRYDTIEVGKVTLSINGDLTGVGTKFTEVLRGMPNFPARIRLVNSQHNTLEYDVLEVIDDTHAVLMHPAVNGTGVATFDVEQGLDYAVVGTFTPGVAVPQSDKYPFRYDSMSYALVPENTQTSTQNIQSAVISDISDSQRPDRSTTFTLARVKVQGSDILIQDFRTKFWETKGSHTPIEIEEKSNPLIGVEYIKWQNTLSPANTNEVFIAWGMRSQNWAIDTNNNIVTLFGSSLGGTYKTVDDFTNGSFNGWRIYTQNGQYSRIVSSVKQGQAINLTLDVLNVNNFSNDVGETFNNEGEQAQWLLVVPDCEEIEIKCTPHKITNRPLATLSVAESNIVEQSLTFNNNTECSFVFPINTLIGRCDLDVYLNPTCLYNIQYRYKTEKTYSEYRTLPVDTVGYYLEKSFDDRGHLRSIEDRSRFPYSPKPIEGYIQLTICPRAYSIFIDLVYKGDKIGVQTVTQFNTIQVYELRVRRDKKYQFITGNISLQDDVYISLSNIGAVEGNEFHIHLNAANIALNGRKIYIIRDYDTGTPVILKEIGQGDIYASMNQDGGILFHCTFSDTNKWNVVYQNYQLGVPNQIIQIDGVIDDLFNSGGIGKVKGLYGHALCNGDNQTSDMRNLFLVGAGSLYQPGDQGGENSIKLTGPQSGVGSHIHAINDPGHSHSYLEAFQTDRHSKGNHDGSRINKGWSNTQSQFTNISIQAASADAQQAHENRPPFYAVIYAKKLY